jgi:cold shock CspA family protein
MDDTDTKQLKGTVKVWFEPRGFGWVERHDKEPDIFLHISDLPNDYDFALQRGDRVAFATGTDRKGRPTAVKAVILEAKDGEPGDIGNG